LAKRELFELRNLVIGKAAPDIEGEDIDGKKFKLSDYRGKVVLLAFWGNWCGPCRAMYPHERSLVNKLKDKPFVLIGINSDSNREDLKKVLEKEEITWRSWWDGGSTRGPIASQWNVQGWPTLYLLDHKGVIVDRSVAYRDMGGRIEQLVAKAEGGPTGLFLGADDSG
jgi:thiol-disulfide isomerase/thioredoxin